MVTITESLVMESPEPADDYTCPNGDAYCTDNARCTDCLRDALDEQAFAEYWEDAEWRG